MTDARRLSARLREEAQNQVDGVCQDEWLSCHEARDRAAKLLSDAARLAELVESAKTLANLYGLGSKRTAKAISALLAFDLIGRGGVDG